MLTPVITGALFGTRALAGLLAGALVSECGLPLPTCPPALCSGPLLGLGPSLASADVLVPCVCTDPANGRSCRTQSFLQDPAASPVAGSVQTHGTSIAAPRQAPISPPALPVCPPPVQGADPPPRPGPPVQVSGVQMAVSMSNTGGAWDNAKKYIEAGNTEHARELGGKGSDAHKVRGVE